ncbi:hypothetical protein LTR66_000290 [Elasticomyces elasticus]|nr:hypothetical protein LTR66_000290 [Elasticomyces elasticus]
MPPISKALSSASNGGSLALARSVPRPRTAPRQIRAGVQVRSLTIRQLDENQDGWAGYTLSRALDARKYQPVVVSPRSYFVFTPLLASTSVGTLEFRTALEPVRSRRSGTHFFQGWADDVDFSRRTISIEQAVEDHTQGRVLAREKHDDKTTEEKGKEQVAKDEKGDLFEMRYDKLIVTVGCYNQTFGTKGVKEHAFFLKDVSDARKIRNRMLACFETAALPTTSPIMRKQLLNFAVVGGGPTGIEFSAELHDIIAEDMSKLYPELIQHFKITVYDVADKVLSMFDDKLSKFAMDKFSRQGIDIRTSHHVEELRKGVPAEVEKTGDVKDPDSCYTLKLKDGAEVGVGMCVWSTGLMTNPFVEKALGGTIAHSQSGILFGAETDTQTAEEWHVKRDPKSGAIITDDRLRIRLAPADDDNSKDGKAALENVFALGDCAVMENSMYPATAQVASQKATWLAKRLNKGDLDTNGFSYRDLGVMAYVGNWNAIMQSGGGNISGRVAWLVWRGAYLAKSVSWRNRILIPIYWVVNWLFGRDISRF